MKTKLLLLFFAWTLIKQGHGDRFEVKDNEGQVCMIVEMEATFQLSRNKQEAPVFHLKNATLDTEASSCGLEALSSYLRVILQPNEEPITFVFKKTDTGTVELNVFLEFKPIAHFPGAENTTLTLTDSTPHLDVGKAVDSYECMSEPSVPFVNGVYEMTMTISDVHLQAFNVKDGGFSPAMVCDSDDTTSVAPATDETTVTDAPTSPATETTTQETTQAPGTTESTATPMPTTPPPTTPTPTLKPLPVEHHFVVKEDDVVCLVMNATFTLHIPYNTTADETKTAVIQIPKDATVSPDSKCDTGNGTEELLEIRFFDDDWRLAIRVVKDMTARDIDLRADDDFDYSWRIIALTYKENTEHFPDIKTPSDLPKIVDSGDIDGDFRAHTNGSYMCDSQKTVNLKAVQLDMTNVQYKAFGNTDSEDFTGDVAECPDDSGGDDDDDNHTLAIALGAGLGGLALVIVIGVIIWKVRSASKRGYKDLDKQPL